MQGPFKSARPQEGVEPSRLIRAQGFSRGKILRILRPVRPVQVVPQEGIEPSRLIQAQDFKSCASTNSATAAHLYGVKSAMEFTPHTTLLRCGATRPETFARHP